jgi:hypothetical protein
MWFLKAWDGKYTLLLKVTLALTSLSRNSHQLAIIKVHPMFTNERLWWFCRQTENYVHLFAYSSVPIAVTFDELKRSSQNDLALKQVCKLSRDKSERFKPYYHVRHNLTVKDWLILKGNKLCIPELLQSREITNENTEKQKG